MPKVVIVGAGLVGALNACFFAKRGWIVEIYEQREDIRKLEHVKGRSINLALSIRGKSALEYVGLKDYIMDEGVKMFARFIHDQDGLTTNRQPYGKTGEHILSINRRHLNEVMITLAEKNDNVTFFFEHKLLHCRVGGEVVLERLSDNQRITVNDGDLFCGCDGAYSAMRRSLMTFPRFNFSQEYIPHGYIELNILPKSDQFAIEPNVFHLWPRGDFVLIALANKDKTFTVTLFAPFTVFEKKLNDKNSVIQFFQKFFPDALELIGRSDVIKTFEQVKPSPLVSVKCQPHHFGDNIILLGDAAHAMVPFYGQGMNCGFEDCLVLNEKMTQYDEDIPVALQAYSNERCPDAHAINDLAMYNYLELRDLVNSRMFKMRKKLDVLLNKIFGSKWTPLYSMVTFSRIRYHQAVKNRHWQDKVSEFNVFWRTIIWLFSNFWAVNWFGSTYDIKVNISMVRS